MNDIKSIKVSDAAIGQDTMEVRIRNPHQKYFAKQAFRRGIRVDFSGGLSNKKIVKLFGGTISRISAKGSMSGEHVTLHCTTVNTLKKEYKSPSMEVYKDKSPIDVVALLCLEAELGFSIEANARNIELAKRVRADFYPYMDETIYQRIMRIAYSDIGVDVAIKDVGGRPTVTLKDPPNQAPAGAIVDVAWGRDVITYSFSEKNEARAPEREVETKHTSQYDKAFISSYQEEEAAKEREAALADSVAVPTNLEGFTVMHGADNPVTMFVKVPFTPDKSVTERRVAAVAVRAGSREMTADITIKNHEIIRAFNRVRILNVGPYSGVYFVNPRVETTFDMSGFTQRLFLSSKRASNNNKRDPKSFGSGTGAGLPGGYNQDFGYEDKDGAYRGQRTWPGNGSGGRAQGPGANDFDEYAGQPD